MGSDSATALRETKHCGQPPVAAVLGKKGAVTTPPGSCFYKKLTGGLDCFQSRRLDMAQHLPNNGFFLYRLAEIQDSVIINA